jgi:O-methyltransferase
MPIPALKLVNLAVILVMLVILIRYIWDLFFISGYEPAEWEIARKTHKIPRDLLKSASNYTDKVRFFNFWLQIQRLKKENVPGCFAELGVYKGETARLIHLMDLEREFHLFDTFNGFPESDLRDETGEASTYTTDNFKDTSVEETLKTIGGDRSKLIIHAGYFPESAVGLENTSFAFVSIDADLYFPTKSGLEFFYPLLSPGGVILIHDYNYKWEGLKRAVDEFCDSIPETPVLVPDLQGSVMITRSRR